MTTRKISTALALAATVGGLAAAPAPALAQSRGLGGLFACEGSGKKQEGGALIGAAAGALLGRNLAKNEKTLGTLVGAAAGAAAGGYIGCRMQSTDAALAEQATKKALETGVAQTWTNKRTGNSGRIAVVSSSYGPPIDGRNVRYASGVQSLPSYEAAGGAYVANSTANLRAGPSTRTAVVGKVGAGESFDALGLAPAGGWVLVGRNGLGVGYASASLVRPYGQQVASCRVIDASVSGGGQRATSQRYSACRDDRGEWQVTQA
ncbi:SH3 domain-containing protein [Caulobacter segnis]|jgi:surface antigen|uniref:SH3 domain-containing protein n=1 Tax=Caulobacter segnis TaxID=88688 RepID=UPI001CBF01E0|nr:SH3 domain-containing protein [Caulobacter segnis]UAL11107.1 SH3 domain-containing protein [Caulobacter segnis]